MSKNRFKILCLLIAGLLIFPANPAMAVKMTVAAHISFDTPISLVKNSDINFGAVKAGTAGTYTMTTAGAATASGDGAYLHGMKSAGSISLKLP